MLIIRNLSLKRVWSLINVLQLITHIYSLNIIFPANAHAFLDEIKDMLSLKIINTGFIFQKLKVSALSLNKVAAQSLSSSGYGSYSMFSNLGYYVLIGFAIIILIFLLKLIRLIVKKWKFFEL